MNPEPTIGTKWTAPYYTKTFRVVGMVDGLVVSRFVVGRYVADLGAVVDTLDWWRKHAIIIPDPPKIEAGYRVVWEDGITSAMRHTLAGAWSLVDAQRPARGVVEVIPDDHGGARLVPVDRDGNRIGEGS